MSHKRLKRSVRLQVAKNKWLPNYTGKKILRGYKKHFAVDTICAIKELEMLGIEFDAQYKEQLLKAEERKTESRRKQKLLKESEDLAKMYPDSNDTFYFITGYTSAGFAYGITWEQLEVEPYDFEAAEKKFNRGYNCWEIRENEKEEKYESDLCNIDDEEIFVDNYDGDIPF
ncbi:MAG: hypothetical protein KAX49_20410 [Halanaerobiales bacterium]|nr:hypothetical protein [Halanaerobiales bacterium]